jgi:hypothetical protein
MSKEFDKNKLIEKIIRNSFYEPYPAKFFYWHGEVTANEITNKGKEILRDIKKDDNNGIIGEVR